MKTFILIMSLALFALNTYGQTAACKGRIVDLSDGSPVVGASTVLMDTDSTYIRGSASGPQGLFTLNDLPQGHYLLKVSFIGYREIVVAVHTGQGPLEIALEPSATVIDEVTIIARSIIEKNDRKVILPSSEQIRTSTDGADLLRKMQL
ncbi:MAG: carboxypeptidase-like regulatory domain-containing protein, partial [Rikenellaceae bacterium]|nr:carboxypeptidase-like regulatory domain-containing protein [Rikenellaceae bacterium]